MKRGKIREGQLRPLTERLSEVELDKRTYRINARRQMAKAIGTVRAVTAAWQAVRARSIWGRLMFAFRGR